MGLDNTFSKFSLPIETNRQRGSLFRRWMEDRGLEIKPVELTEFQKDNQNAV